MTHGLGKLSPTEEFKPQTAASFPGVHGRAFDDVGGDPRDVAAAVQNLVLHPLFAGARDVAMPAVAAADREARSIRRLLDRVKARDSKPLWQPRGDGEKFFGTCRDYALLACSLFCHNKVPARLRVGFADYFTAGFLEDHWLCEYWDGGAWKLLDAELDRRAMADFAIDFDPTDVPDSRFLRAGAAWRRVRADALDPARLGVSVIGASGQWFAAGSLFRDIAVLAGREELLPWDYWGQASEFDRLGEVPEPWQARLDELAPLLAGADVALDQLLRAYATRDWLYLEDRVKSYPRGEPVEIDLDLERR
jgi:hypothetical protein